MKCWTLVWIVLVVASSVMAQTDIPPGEVSGYWEPTGSPFRNTGDIEIPAYATLKIDPGVRIEFQGHFTLKVSGRLLAKGFPGDTILFTVADTAGFSDPGTTLGGWNGITVQVAGSLNDSTLKEYCRLEFGKAAGDGWPWSFGGAMRIIDSDRVRVSHCRFTSNMATGPEEVIPAGGALHCSNSDIVLRSNIFEDNIAAAGGAIHLQGSDVVFTYNTLTNNRCTLDGGAVSIAGGSNPSFRGGFHCR